MLNQRAFSKEYFTTEANDLKNQYFIRFTNEFAIFILMSCTSGSKIIFSPPSGDLEGQIIIIIVF